MADNDVIGGLDNLIDTISGDTPSYTVKDPDVDMVKAIDKCIDAAKGVTGKTYEYKDPNTDVIQKMDELAGAISESGGGGSATLIEKSVTSNGTYKASDDEADGYSQVSVSVSPNVGTKSITENGTYAASSDSLDGYSSVTVNVGGSVPTLTLHSGKINLSNGQISADSNYYYSDYFDAPNGNLMFDLGEENYSDYVGLEMCTAGGSHYNYYSASRYRVVDHSSRYALAPKLRISFRAVKLNDVIVKNLVNGTTYSVNVVELSNSAPNT